MDTVIRPIQQDDFLPFVRLMSLFFQYANNPPLDDKELQHLFRTALDPNSNYLIFCAVESKEIVGMISGTIGQSSFLAKPFAWCDDFFVREDFRGQGIGKALLDKVESWAREHSCSSILVGVGQNEHAALTFYARSGFTDMHCKLLSRPLT